MNRSDGSSLLSKCVIGFWALYFSLVVATNTVDLLKAIGAAPSDWTFASGDYQSIVDVTSRYGVPRTVTLFMFVGVILWEGIAAAMFWERLIVESNRWSPSIPFVVSVALWFAFVLADEFFIEYKFESAHRQLAILTLVSWMVVHWSNGKREVICLSDEKLSE
jgi:hypothetical protein